MANDRAPETKRERAIRLFKGASVVRPKDLAAHGIPRKYLTELEQEGKILRVGRGLYVAANASLTENHSLAEAAKRVPQGVVCLLSALQFHGLTDELPFEVWLALPAGSWTPRPGTPPLRVVRFSGASFTEGVEEHEIESVPVRIYSPAKTVADLFKFRRTIGLDVAIAALRDTLEKRRAKPAELMRYASICRVSRVMRPYLEALL